jgi:excisionase family DNA binding protein
VPAQSSTYPVDHDLPAERLLSVREVAEMLNVREWWVYIKTETRDLPFVKLGRYLRFRPSDIEAYLEAQRRSVGTK